MHSGAVKLIFQNAKELRNRATHAEEVLWNLLCKKPFGYKFRRQHPFSIYILDFYCHALKLVIEVDGSIHDEIKVQENDQVRQDFLEREGLMVLRFSYDEVIHEMQNVTVKIEVVIHSKHK